MGKGLGDTANPKPVSSEEQVRDFCSKFYSKLSSCSQGIYSSLRHPGLNGELQKPHVARGVSF